MVFVVPVPDEKVDLESTGIILVFVNLRIFALMEGGKIKWEVIFTMK